MKGAGEAPGPGRERFGHQIARPLLSLALRAVLRIYAHWEVIGLENIPATGGVLIAANHSSYVDPLLGWAAVSSRRRMWGVAKVELWNDKRVAFFMDTIDGIPVKRGAADRGMLKRVLGLLAEGKTVGIFPEGTRTHDGLLNVAQPGVALMVQKSGAAVVPTALIGTYEMLPRGSSRLRRTKLKVVFGKPLAFPPEASRDQITGEIMKSIAELMTSNGKPTEAPASNRTTAEQD